MSEKDQTKWVGIRPVYPEEFIPVTVLPSGGSWIFATNNVNGTSSTLYTVPTGKTGYVIYADLNATYTGTDQRHARIEIRDSLGILQAYLVSVALNGSSYGNACLSFPVPVKLETGSYISLVSPVTGLAATGSVCIYVI